MTEVVLASADDAFFGALEAALPPSDAFTLTRLEGEIADVEGAISSGDPGAVIFDANDNRPEDLDALARVMERFHGRVPAIVVTNNVEEPLTRLLLRLRVSDLLIKPVATDDIVSTLRRVTRENDNVPSQEAKIVTFLPAGGGVGVTTLALQAAFLFHGSQQRSGDATCVADLNFQHGACADFLDLEPRLDLNEVEPRPERLDRQLLEVMISKHDSGLAVIAAPNRPAEMRSFDPAMVTRLLDLVSAHFGTVVIDMPRTWFSWTDSVLLGSDKIYIVSEATVPGLRQTQRLITAIEERFGGDVDPKVIVNRFDSRRFGSGLQHSDVDSVLSGRLAGTVSNNYQLVREAVDRGVPIGEVEPNNNITLDLKKILMPEAGAANASRGRSWFMPFRRAASR